MNKNKGFTLLELIIYFALLAIILLILINIFVFMLDLKLSSQANSSIEQDGRFILSRLGYDVNRAGSITTPTNAGTSSSLSIVICSTTYTYQMSGTDLTITTSDDPTHSYPLNASDDTVSNLVFTRIGSNSGKDTVKAIFTLSSKSIVNTRNVTLNFDTTVGLR